MGGVESGKGRKVESGRIRKGQRFINTMRTPFDNFRGPNERNLQETHF